MDTPSSEISSDSSESSADSASVSADSTPAQVIQTSPERSAPSNSATIDEEDTDSDISMSAETNDDEEDEDADEAGTPTQQVKGFGRTEEPHPRVVLDTLVEATNKRKYEETTEPATNGHFNGSQKENWKRLKPDDEIQSLRTSHGSLRLDKSLLPAEIWHHIFTFIRPRSLGLLLRVNKCFNAYLDASSPFTASHTPLSKSASKILRPDAIWKASRVLFRPGMPGFMPGPLAKKSELDMWRLACSSTCQFCGKKQQPNSHPTDQWHPGPGENGNAPVWSFGVRTCGPCLQKNSAKVGS
jgi:hypothetical protein